jgi:hypothetical protein
VSWSIAHRQALPNVRWLFSLVDHGQRELGEVFSRDYLLANEVDHPLVDEIRRNSQGDGAHVSSDPTNRSCGSGYRIAGPVEITAKVRHQQKEAGSLLFSFT